MGIVIHQCVATNSVASHTWVECDIVRADTCAVGISLSPQYRASLIFECQAEEDWRASTTLLFLYSSTVLELRIGKRMVLVERANFDVSLAKLSEGHGRVSRSWASGDPATEDIFEE